ncbi:MAG: hypothetical protein DRN17_05155 [Thermoplasmata archaeon]|nr:MAG: hypothetical protein DRN17_05155 [Thermoplasmata archaeon]
MALITITKTQRKFMNRAREELKEIKEIFTLNATDFFLLYGTCLGAVREQDIISWDFDLDIGVLDHTNQTKIYETFIEHGFKFKRHAKRWQVSKRIDHTDVIWYIREADKLVCRGTKNEVAFSAPARFFNSFDTVKIRSESYLAPHPVREYLNTVYGGNWKHPNRFKRGVLVT